MSDGVNKVILLGNLTADPDLRFGQGGGAAILKIRMATNSSWFDKKENQRKEAVEYHQVTVFGPRAEALQKILHKGTKCFVEGALRTTSYEKEGQKKYTTEIIANEIVLCDGRRDGAGGAGGGERTAARQQAQEAAPAGNDSDDIPF
jgi:single-strand DNA-binding protein